ncbi:Endonuclease/exonuclease/phosphatase [Madurella fahalii]|uniref:Endonuclease/exonuclease/phosphatase n=1 Tax=Madurella fahalii TaxID=1157608 RepID=A0ABQ0GLN8_9PEZI
MDREISPPPTKRRKLRPASLESTPSSNSLNPNPESMRPRRSIRIFSWNINGVDPYLPSPSHKITSFFKPLASGTTAATTTPHTSTSRSNTNPSSLRAFLSRHNFPEALFLQELKIAPGSTAKATLSALQSSLNALPTNPDHGDDAEDGDNSRAYDLHAVLPRDRYNARGFGGKLYGVGTVLRRDFAREWVVCARGAEWDLEGRVGVVEMRKAVGGAQPVLALVNVYAVNGTGAPYRDPATGAVVGTRHDWKVAFHSRLRDECLALEGRGFRVVVAGDLNVARGVVDGYPGLRTWPRRHCVNRADFNRKFFGEEDNRRAGAYVEGAVGQGKCLDAVDVFRAIYGKERKYTYYPRTKEWGSSCDRVDLILVSKGLWEAGRVLGTGILDTPQERGLSDHVPLWVEVAWDEKPEQKQE